MLPLPFSAISYLGDRHVLLDRQPIFMCLCQRIQRKIYHRNRHLHSLLFGAGGFLEAQFVRIALLPIHCPFIPAIAFSAS